MGRAERISHVTTVKAKEQGVVFLARRFVSPASGTVPGS